MTHRQPAEEIKPHLEAGGAARSGLSPSSSGEPEVDARRAFRHSVKLLAEEQAHRECSYLDSSRFAGLCRDCGLSLWEGELRVFEMQGLLRPLIRTRSPVFREKYEPAEEGTIRHLGTLADGEDWDDSQRSTVPSTQASLTGRRRDHRRAASEHGHPGVARAAGCTARRVSRPLSLLPHRVLSGRRQPAQALPIVQGDAD